MDNSLHRNLSIAVVVLGLAGYCVSFGPTAAGGGNDWHVRFAVLAALVAAIGLFPKQTARPWLPALLAAAGFLDALSSVLTTSSGWVLTTIAVLTGLQAVAAGVALWLAPETPAAAGAAGGYEAYLDYYNQAVQQYYQQTAAAQPDSPQRSAYGQAYAQAYGQSQAQAPATGAGAARATQQAPQYGDYADLLSPQQDYGRSATAAPAQTGGALTPPGRAGAGPAQAPAPHVRADESARPGEPM
ncbi:DUF5336 domain-containing protein [Mycolicibacterium neworleansense]|uniref:Transmembrane protein n=1 Tax=Mycolicibacterium neworleansense TaxID=146018 RepID=A0A0H5RUA8_9MYCO|nr:DUF5336 domain-containing protein [Mycolicibacterium neworleansense]MCV7360653.1 DUF5336 domain-containing protein [Mycolicibacterium neworleansense]CRZ17730.1 hypothetical protein BN2156_04622 [Mycolicibacterium neworleansense]